MARAEISSGRSGGTDGQVFAPEGCFAYVYFEPDPNNETRRTIMQRLTRDEARRIAANIAKLPTFIEGGQVSQG